MTFKHQTMKRKNVGQLTLRGKKTKPKPNASKVFFNSHDLICGELSQFLDEYDKLMLTRVNKVCNDAIYHNAPKDRHFMFDYFARNNICMVCLSACTGKSKNNLGLYVHNSCRPSPSLFVLDTGSAVPRQVDHAEIEPGMNIQCLYHINVPFIINRKLTLSYRTSREFPIYHKIYTRPEYEKYDIRLRELVQSINKANYIKQKIDLGEKVRLGSNLISLHTAFTNIYPMETDVHTTIVRYNELRDIITNLHNEMVRFFSEFVRPNIYVKAQGVTTTWGHFVKHHENSLRNYSKTFMEWIIAGRYLEPSRWRILKNKMKGWVILYNDRQLKRSLKHTLHQVGNMHGEIIAFERINIYRSVDMIVDSFCDGSDEFQRIIDTTQTKYVFNASAGVLNDQIKKVGDMFIDLYKNIIVQDEARYKVKGVRICDFNVHIKRLIRQFGLFHFDLLKFPERFLIATFKFHPIDVFNAYSPDTFYCDDLLRQCKDFMTQRGNMCVCGFVGQLCEEHLLCPECCYCNT